VKRGWILAILFSALPLAAQTFGDRNGGWLMVDFRAYYCASSALVHHENPYAAASLHACERQPAPSLYVAPPAVTVPAPYPPYALVLLTPFVALPFAAAATVWFAFLAVCVFVAALALARVTARPVLLPFAALALSLGLTALPGGNVMPVCIAALAVAAACLRSGRFAVAAIAIAVAMVEPHVALPAALALFVADPRARFPLAITLGVLAALSFAAGGIATNLTYVGAVVPAHAFSEVSRDNQYSLSTIVSAFGASDATAVLIGGISYVVALVFGVTIATRLARDGGPAYLVLLPPAIGLLGGSFVHTVEVAAAVPAALLLCTAVHPRSWWLVATLVLLAVPWMMATSASMFLAPFYPIAYLIGAFGVPRTAAYTSALASITCILLLFALAAHPAGLPIAHHVARPFIDPSLAEASWRQFVLSDTTNRPVTWLLRLPTWIGLVTLALLATMRAFGTAQPQPATIQAAR
jgi:hypothetical protein